MGGSASTLRLPRVVLVVDAKQLDAVDAGKPFAQLQSAGMKTATMEDILRQKDPDLKAAVEASLARDVKRAFEKLGRSIEAVKPDNLAGTDGAPTVWEPGRLAARSGGVEVYRTDAIELREGDRIRWTRNDMGLGLVNSATAEVARPTPRRARHRRPRGASRAARGGYR